MTATAWMTWEQAISVALTAALLSGGRYRVRKSRAVVGWWMVERTYLPRVTAPAVNKAAP